MRSVPVLALTKLRYTRHLSVSDDGGAPHLPIEPSGCDCGGGRTRLIAAFRRKLLSQIGTRSPNHPAYDGSCVIGFAFHRRTTGRAGLTRGLLRQRARTSSRGGLRRGRRDRRRRISRICNFDRGPGCRCPSRLVGPEPLELARGADHNGSAGFLRGFRIA
jgi:hypothetical protein